MYAEDLGEDLAGPHEVVDTDDVRDDVEGVVVEGQCRVDVEVVLDVLRELRVPRELRGVHAEARDAPEGRVRRQVRHPRRARV